MKKIPNNVLQAMLKSGIATLVDFAKENNAKSNFEIACEALKIKPIIPEGLSSQMQAAVQLEAIIKVANAGKTPDVYNTDTYKYYPVFTPDNNGVLVLHYVHCWCSTTLVPAPFLFNDEETCREVVENNMDLYIQLNTYKD